MTQNLHNDWFLFSLKHKKTMCLMFNCVNIGFYYNVTEETCCFESIYEDILPQKILPLSKSEEEAISDMQNRIEKFLQNTHGLSVHQRSIILRGICNGAALRGKQPQIVENNTVIVCSCELNVWDICIISCDAEAFGLKAEYHYDGVTKIEFTQQVTR